MKDEEIVKILQDDSVSQNTKSFLFKQLIEKYENELYKTIYNYISSKGTKEDVEDVLIETFFRFYKNIKKFRFKTTVKNFLYRIAINLAINFLRSKKVELVSFEEIKDQLEDESSIDKELCEKEKEYELKKVVTELINRLPHKQKAALYLVVYGKMAYKDVADVLKTSVSSVESLVFRAKQNLKKFILKDKKLKELFGIKP